MGKRVSYRVWEVHSDSGKTYSVALDPNHGWRCNCIGFMVHERSCKHINAVKKTLIEARAK